MSRAAVPSSFAMVDMPENMPEYLPGLTCMLHLVTSRGVISVCVRPHAKMPPRQHLA